jgi:5-methylcytosine-specific restriction endonuclease McrA
MLPERLFVIPPHSKAEPSAALIRRIHLRDAHACVYCGADDVPLVVDHVRSLEHFHAKTPAATVNDPANLVTACMACQQIKGPNDLAGFVDLLRGRGVESAVVAAMVRSVRRAGRQEFPPAGAGAKAKTPAPKG